jgi:signal transduction histidine kinase
MLHDPNHPDLFPKLSDEELSRLAPHGRELTLNPGEIIFREGDINYHFYVVLDGQLEIIKHIGQEEQLLTVHQPGEFTGEISLFTGSPATATGRSLGVSRVLEIDGSTFKSIVSECSQTATLILTAMSARAQEVEQQLRHQEKLAALGRLSAGLAHELNNPAAAGRRASKQLRESIATIQARLLNHCEELFPDPSRQQLIQVQQTALHQLSCGVRLSPLEQSDREDALADWLDQQGLDDGWQLAPILVGAGLQETHFSDLAEQLTPAAFAEALHWLTDTLTLVGLANEVEQSTGRISELVKAVKAYSYMDQAPLQEIDVHEGLDNTLTILNHKLKYGITVQRDYAAQLPRICAYGSELNQVWTNLLDNAIDALKDGQSPTKQPIIQIRTSQAHKLVQVEIIDNGPGIPADVQSRIFDPFFTTKGVGKGTGLGLDIVRRIVTQRHRGTIRVFSEPGQTRFVVCLPIQPKEMEEPNNQENRSSDRIKAISDSE